MKLSSFIADRGSGRRRIGRKGCGNSFLYRFLPGNGERHSRMCGGFTLIELLVVIARAVFQKMYWHDGKRLGFGNVLFVDGQAGDYQATNNKPDYQHGPNWSFIYNDY